jgi:hypothetical protein
MEFLEIKERLAKLETAKLIDVVKNYRQYGYNDEIRNYAITLLEKKGISTSDLQLTGNFENAKYEYVGQVFNSFNKNSKIAFIFYAGFVCIRFILPHLLTRTESINILLLIAYILSFVVFFIFLLISFLDQSKFYKLTGDDYGADGALVYLFIGMPFYIFMYFVFQKQMRERFKLVT